MKLFAFIPESIGVPSYFVMAESESEARDKVGAFVASQYEYVDQYKMAWERTGEYETSVFGPGEVIEHDNF